MAGKKKRKKERKAARKAEKAKKKAARRAAKLARSKVARAAGKPAKAKAARKRKPARRAAPAAAKSKARAFQDRRLPESLRLRSAGPSFTVNDIQASLAFYRDVLGFTAKDRWEEQGELKGIELVAGSVSFWLAQDDWKKGRDRVKGVGVRMYCGTSQDIDALAERARAAGALAEEPKDQPWGGRDFAVRDPDGYLISISNGL